MTDSQTWQSDAQYQCFLQEAKSHLDTSQREMLDTTYAEFSEKLSSLNLDDTIKYLSQFYSDIGRPARNQSQLIRSFVLHYLMAEKELASLSLTKWVDRLQHDPVLATMIGCTCDSLPPFGSYFDFMDRCWFDKRKRAYARNAVLLSNHNSRKFRKSTKRKGKKAKTDSEEGDGEKPLRKGDKAADPSKVKVADLINRLSGGVRLTPNFEAPLQEIFYYAAVLPSIQAGIIPEDGLIVSGDGTCIHTHASPFGKDCDAGMAKPNVTVTNPDTGQSTELTWKHYSDPDAAIGWDSDLAANYFGYTLYTLSVHSSEYGVDLPVLLRVTSAKRHDSVNLTFALDEMQAHEPDIHPAYMCLDSAHDNGPTYQYLSSIGTVPMIDINKRATDKPRINDNITVNDEGTPVCQAGKEMYWCGYDKTHYANKWRCPFCAQGKEPECSCKCSESKYGRTIYTKTKQDPRYFPRIPRESEEFKKIYNNRTACERVNDRILNDYKLGDMYIHYREHISFAIMIIGICLHLDAWYKVRHRNV